MKRKGVTAKFARPETRIIGLLTDKELAEKSIESWVQEDAAEMELLRQEYGIPNTALKWYRLALELAREAYPKPGKRGPKTKWNGFVCGALVVEVDRLVAANKGKPGKGLSWALHTVGKQKRWANFVEQRGGTGRDEHPGIEWYYDHNKDSSYAKIMRNAFAYILESNTVEEWETIVDDLLKRRLYAPERK